MVVVLSLSYPNVGPSAAGHAPAPPQTSATGPRSAIALHRAGNSFHDVRSWERDHREPRVVILPEPARALGVPMEEWQSP